MGVSQFTTPTFVLTFANEQLDLTTALNIYVTFSCVTGSITKSGNSLTISEKQIDVYLTQEECGNLFGDVEIQANWTFVNGDRAASDIQTVKIDKNLLRRVVE